MVSAQDIPEDTFNLMCGVFLNFFCSFFLDLMLFDVGSKAHPNRTKVNCTVFGFFSELL